MPAHVREVWTQAQLTKRSNVFMFVLDSDARLVHAFNAVRGGARGKEGPSSSQEEITKAIAELKLPDAAAQAPERPVLLPDIAATKREVPAGVRLFVRPNGQGGGKQVVVELVPTMPEEWSVLAFPETPREVKPEALRAWLVQMYPPAIRTADQEKPFTKIVGSLKLEPAGADVHGRYAVLHGDVHLTKGDEKESAFQGRLQAVLSYRREGPEVQSLRGVVEGDYLYRIRGTQTIPLIAAIESRPEPDSLGTK